MRTTIVLLAILLSPCAYAASDVAGNHWAFETGQDSSINGVKSPHGYKMRMNQCDLSTPEKIKVAQEDVDRLVARMPNFLSVGKSGCVIEIEKIKP